MKNINLKKCLGFCILDFQERLAGVLFTSQPCLGVGLGEQALHQHFCLYGFSERPAGDFPGSSTHPVQSTPSKDMKTDIKMYSYILCSF